ncbi:AraC family transcriptional regulator [Flavobacterium sp. H122]|uniref:helix-turn-helix domain-containing protein n=1 Tax=Flavobacterium sp. H122 TaxID=2529860 RepID=UPI00145A9283|nr:AraC family transcriptional regulator [Flavobacterium sp. H122]
MKKFAVLNIGQFGTGNRIEGFHVNTIENHLITAHRNIHKPHKHNFYLTVLFTHGNGVHEIDFVKYEVKPGSLFFLNPGQMHHWELSDDTRGFIVFHSQSFYDLHFVKEKINHYPFFHSIQNLPVLYLEKESIGYFSRLFQEILSENTSVQIFKIPKIIALAELIYIEATRLYMGDEELEMVKLNTYSEKFQQFERLVEANYKTEKAASQYADWLHISPKHLNRITQNMVNKTTTDIILERVFLEAKRELISQKFTFSEIASDLGYADYAYFSRLFKKKCGETPSEFLYRYR